MSIETGENFWEEADNTTDFFSSIESEEKGPGLDSDTVLKEVNKDDSEEEDDKTEISTEEDLFSKTDVSETDDEEEEEEEDGDDEDAPVSKKPNTFLVQKLKEKGYIDFDLEEDEELTEELAEEILEEKFDESVDNKVKELMSELPEDKQQVIQFLLKGGSIEGFVNAVYSSGSSDIDVEADLDSEKTQISEMKKLLRLEDKDEEEIETEIEFLKDSGKLKAMAEKKMAKYKESVEARKAEVVQAQQKAMEDAKRAIKEAKAKVSAFLEETKEADGIQFSKDDKKTLPSFMNDRAIKLQNGQSITEMQKILFYDIPKNEKAHIQLAALLKNRNEDGTFNFDAIKTDARTKVADEVRDGIRRNKKSIPVSSKIKSGKPQKGLADYFNN